QAQPTIGVTQVTEPIAIVTSTIEYRDTGVILTVTPRISEKRLVAMDIKQEVSDAIPNLLGGTQSPIITKRVAETSVVVADSQTLVLGGLLEERRTRDREGIPGLSRIPVLGYLFGQTTDTVKKTELLILITPRVVGDPAEARALYEEVRRRSRELEKAIQQAPSMVPPAPLPAPPPSENPAPNPGQGSNSLREWR
ncbi:MAG: type II and III secretion system protein, partial [Candidatus Rokubacteria bacterium]|nr:type II and III secretion system protein [Candidatus Rokubacteria bacterium]